MNVVASLLHLGHDELLITVLSETVQARAPEEAGAQQASPRQRPRISQLLTKGAMTARPAPRPNKALRYGVRCHKHITFCYVFNLRERKLNFLSGKWKTRAGRHPEPHTRPGSRGLQVQGRAAIRSRTKKGPPRAGRRRAFAGIWVCDHAQAIRAEARLRAGAGRGGRGGGTKGLRKPQISALKHM